jgi:hypothetical protein
MISQEGAKPPLKHPKGFCLSKLLNLIPLSPNLSFWVDLNSVHTFLFAITLLASVTKYLSLDGRG